MKDQFISDFKSGTSFRDVELGVNSIKRAEDRNGKPYWDLELVDKSGAIKAKAWSELVARYINLNPQQGEVYRFSGEVSEFRGQLQVTLVEMGDVADYDLNDFVRSTNKDVKEMTQQLKSYQDKIIDKDISLLVSTFLKKYGKEYVKWPAAKRNHHHFLGGLLEHVLEMLGVAEIMLKFYPDVNSDLVYAGIILHDAGKIKELEVNGFAIDYSLQGNMIGHISLVTQMLENIIYADESKFENLLKSDKWTLLKHIILSHHGKLEFGSPVMPKTIEAGIVSRIDVLSSDARNFSRVMEESNASAVEGSEEQFSASEFTLDNVKVFLGTKKIVSVGSDQTSLLT